MQNTGSCFPWGDNPVTHDGGIVVNGFVALPGPPVFRGVYLHAAYQSAARFAFVLLSASTLRHDEPYYRTNSASVGAAGWIPGGYQTLPSIKGAAYLSADFAEHARALDAVRKVGLLELLSLDKPSSHACHVCRPACDTF